VAIATYYNTNDRIWFQIKSGYPAERDTRKYDPVSWGARISKGQLSRKASTKFHRFTNKSASKYEQMTIMLTD